MPHLDPVGGSGGIDPVTGQPIERVVIPPAVKDALVKGEQQQDPKSLALSKILQNLNERGLSIGDFHQTVVDTLQAAIRSKYDLSRLLADLIKSFSDSLNTESQAVFDAINAGTINPTGLTDEQKAQLNKIESVMKALADYKLQADPIDTTSSDILSESELDLINGLSFLFFSGSGNVTSISSSPDSDSVETIFSQFLFNNFTLDERTPDDPRTFDTFRAIALGVATRVSIASTTSAASLVSDRLALLDFDDPTVDAALALSFGEIITLNNDPLAFTNLFVNLGFSDATAESLSRALHLDLTLFSVASIARAFGFDGLLPQFLANLSSFNALGDFITDLSTVSIEDILKNILVLNTLRDLLLKDLFEFADQLTEERSREIVDAILANILRSTEINSRDSLRRAVRDAVERQRLDTEIQEKLIASASNLIEESLDTPALDQPFDAGRLDVPTLTESLTQQFADQGVSGNILSSILTTLQEGLFQSNREFRDSLQDALLGAGIATPTAQALATEAVHLINPAVTGPLGPNGLVDGISTAGQLREEVGIATYHRLNPLIGDALAGRLSANIAEVLFGEKGLSAITSDNVEEVFKERDDAFITDYLSSIREHFKPITSLDEFHKAVMDPANNILKSYKNAIIYSDSAAGEIGMGGDKRDVDIQV